MQPSCASAELATLAGGDSEQRASEGYGLARGAEQAGHVLVSALQLPPPILQVPPGMLEWTGHPHWTGSPWWLWATGTVLVENNPCSLVHVPAPLGDSLQGENRVGGACCANLTAVPGV